MCKMHTHAHTHTHTRTHARTHAHTHTPATSHHRVTEEGRESTSVLYIMDLYTYIGPCYTCFNKARPPGLQESAVAGGGDLVNTLLEQKTEKAVWNWGRAAEVHRFHLESERTNERKCP